MRVPVTISHRLDNQLVVKMSQCPKLRSKVYDSNGNSVGRLIRIFGPVNSPYGLIAVSKPVDGDETLTIDYKEV